MVREAFADMGWIPFGGSPHLTRVLSYRSQVPVMIGTTLVKSSSESPTDLLGSHQSYALGHPSFRPWPAMGREIRSIWALAQCHPIAWRAKPFWGLDNRPRWLRTTLAVWVNAHNEPSMGPLLGHSLVALDLTPRSFLFGGAPTDAYWSRAQSLHWRSWRSPQGRRGASSSSGGAASPSAPPFVPCVGD
jgi:hypothetical protein